LPPETLIASVPLCDPPRIKVRPKRAIADARTEVHNRQQGAHRATQTAASRFELIYDI